MGQDRNKREKADLCWYNAVPPPYAPPSSSSPVALSGRGAASCVGKAGWRIPLPTTGNEVEMDKKARRRCARKSRQGGGGAAKNWVPQEGMDSGGGSNSDDNAENKDAKHVINELPNEFSNLSVLRSPSPSAMPNPRFRNKSRVGGPKARHESCSFDSGSSSGTRPFLYSDGLKFSNDYVEDNCIMRKYPRNASPEKSEYVPVRNSKPKLVSKFQDYWSIEQVKQALKAGEVFKSQLRVNTFNRNEAYATWMGLPIDILIDGLDKQNRAMEGDTVVVQLDPVSLWCRLKGSGTERQKTDTTYLASDQCRSVLVSYPSTGSESYPQESPQERGGTEDRDFLKSADDVQDDEQSLANNGVETLSFSPKGRGDKQILDSLNSKSLTEVGAHGSSDIESKSQAHESFPNLLDNRCLESQSSEGQEVIKCLSTRSDRSQSKNSEVASETSTQVRATLSSMPNKRPTGKVVHILEPSPRRKAIVGFLDVRFGCTKVVVRGSEDSLKKGQKKVFSKCSVEKFMLIPADSRFPKMVVFSKHLPIDLQERLEEGDPTVGSELLAAEVEEWRADSEFPAALVKQSLGQGGEIEAHTAAILFQNAIHSAAFPPACLACLPEVPWRIPNEELQKRKDLRACRIFSIDPPTAKDLDDALSIEQLDSTTFRVGVHIADVSFFVPPDSALNKEAQSRSTSVYLIQRVLPMLPGLLGEELCSLNPGVDRLAVSVFWDLSSLGHILNQWIGKSIIRSCCKLTYGLAQDMLDGLFDAKCGEEKFETTEKCDLLPVLHGEVTWEQVICDVRALYGIAKNIRELRFKGGALKLDNSKLLFFLDENGNPYESSFYEYKESNMIVEEFMLLANMTVAKIISGVFPECALLRRHPEPNLRKLKELEEFCSKNGFELDTSSAGALQLSLEKMREGLKHDPVLFNVLLLYATKPMQLAKYFCTGEFKDNENEWAHYALATPFYTHFTSPIRRYPDILVHRTLAAALEAEEILCKTTVNTQLGLSTGEARCFTGLPFDKGAAESSTGQRILAIVAEKYQVPGIAELSAVAAYCNERKLASRNVKDATVKLFLWAMIKRNQRLLSDARVLQVGPKFVSLYICKIAMERRLYYDEIDGLKAEWLEATGTLVLDVVQKRFFPKKHGQGKTKSISDIVLLVNPVCLKNPAIEVDESIETDNGAYGEQSPINELKHSDICQLSASEDMIEPAVLPLLLRPFYSVPVSLHAVGGESGPVDVAVKLYLSSYLS